MSLTITAAQRDALRDLILDRILGIDDLRHVVTAGDYQAAERLAWEYSDALRLVSEDLGWGEGPPGSIELKTPPDVLERACTGLRELAAQRAAAPRGPRHCRHWPGSLATRRLRRLATISSPSVLQRRIQARSKRSLFLRQHVLLQPASLQQLPREDGRQGKISARHRASRRGSSGPPRPRRNRKTRCTPDAPVPPSGPAHPRRSLPLGLFEGARRRLRA